MFRKRVKKHFPPGTFIETPARIAAILQLCIAFTIFLSNAGYPFLGEIFHYKSQAILYNDVMGNGLTDTPEEQTRLSRNAARFAALPKQERENIIEKYRVLQSKGQTSFASKLSRSFQILIDQLSVYKQAWMILAVIIPILILLRIEGATYAAWLLPVLAVCYAFANGSPHSESQESKLFPSEEMIIKDYLKEPLSQNISEQQQQLQHGWQLYLIDKWAKQVPNANQEAFKLQVEEGEFAFNLARIKAVEKTPSFTQNEHILSLLLYVLWNLIFAWIVNKKQLMNKLKVV